MTIAAIVIIIIGIIGLIIGIVLWIASYRDGEDGEGITIGIIIAFVAVIMIVCPIPIVYSNTEAGKRSYKDQQSNFEGGIERVIKVYDINGTLIKEYEGTFDIETSNDAKYMLFDDSHGKRHIIYNTTGTVIIDEK